MPFKPHVTKSAVCLFLSTWVIAVSLCGFGAFIPAFLGLPHHASHSMNTECEQACLERSIAHHDVVMGQQTVTPSQPLFESGVQVAYPPSLNAEGLPNLPDSLIHYPTSIKQYQLISSYRI